MTPAIQPRTIIGLTFIGFLIVCALNFWIFRVFFGRNYLEWYANAGPIIALATVAFGSAWGGLDKNPALISTNPLNYLGAWLQVAGLPLMAIGTHVHSSNQPKSLGFEIPLALILMIALLVAMGGWLVLVVPAQYFLFLLVGSLSRIALSSSAHIKARMRSGQVSLSTYHGNPPAPTSPAEAGGPIRSDDREWDASMRDEPFTLANAFGAVLLFVLSMLWT
jgi:hypothetical protein